MRRFHEDPIEEDTVLDSRYLMTNDMRGSVLRTSIHFTLFLGSPFVEESPRFQDRTADIGADIEAEGRLSRRRV